MKWATLTLLLIGCSSRPITTPEDMAVIDMGIPDMAPECGGDHQPCCPYACNDMLVCTFTGSFCALPGTCRIREEAVNDGLTCSDGKLCGTCS